MSTVQTLRYAVGTLEQDIQTAGTNLVAASPKWFTPGRTSWHSTRTMPPGPESIPSRCSSIRTWRTGWPGPCRGPSGRAIPGTSFAYPDSTYLDGSGLPGPAETLIFFFDPDDDTDRDDDYALYRQVNAEEPQLVAKNLLRVEGEPFFRYMKESDFGVDSIPDDLPSLGP